MGTFTAQILIGSSHLNHRGIIPTHKIYLSENSKPALILVSENIEGDHVNEKTVWIPTLENTLDDAMLMISYHIIKDKQIIKKIDQTFKGKNINYRMLYDDFTEEDRLALYELNKKIVKEYQTLTVVLSIFGDSQITDSYKHLSYYDINKTVCKSIYTRQYSDWDEKWHETGEL